MHCMYITVMIRVGDRILSQRHWFIKSPKQQSKDFRQKSESSVAIRD